MATRVSARGMVGRSAELAELEAALSEAATGCPSLAFVAGESGLGKTRLLDEFAARARQEHGARVLIGDCVELGDGELPYAPLVTALRPLARTGDPALDGLRTAVRADLGAIAIGLGPAGADEIQRDSSSPPQARLFEALLSLLTALSAEQPLLLIVEDLHWADSSTRSFLTFLAANLCDERVLVVGSYRPDELHRRHPLRPLLAELERDARARRFELLPMTRDELALQLADILGGDADGELVDRMYRRSEGNPLFCEELLATGLDGRGALPSSLRDALMMRVERLTAPAQQVLRMVAVARTLDHATLAATGDVEPGVLRDAIAGHILVTTDDGDYAFRHALLREVVDDDLLPGERAELHLRLAHALEGRAGEEPSAQLLAHIAHHYAQSGDQPSALGAAIRAGEAALPVHAYGEAASQFERALELWDRVPDAADRAGMSLVLLLARTAMAYDMEGHIVRSETLLRRAVGLAEAEGEDVVTAGLLERLSRAEWALNHQDDSVATLDRAMSLLPDEPSPDRAWLQAGKARYLMLMGRLRSAAEVGRAAREEARVTGARGAEGRACNALGVSLMGLGDVDAGAGVLREAVQIAREDNRLGDLSTALVNLADILHLAGRTGEALRIADEGYAETIELGQRQEMWLGLAVSEFAFDAGDWALAERHLPDHRRRLQGTTLLNALLRRTELALGRGDHEAAGGHLEAADRAAEGSREPQFIAVLGALRAEYERRAGDLKAARAAVEEALDRIEFCTDDVHRIARVAAVGVKVEADAAQQARDLAEPDAEQRAIAGADALIDRVRAAAADCDRPVEVAYLKTVLAERGRACGEDDPAAWATAADAWRELQRPYLVAQVLMRQAEAHVSRGERDAAADSTVAALEMAQELGAGWLADELNGLAGRARLKLPAGVTGDAAAAVVPADEDPFGLTTRERQVLALVARGATNREIGGELFMAEKTASVHVSRILSKLDVRSRTEAAAVAHRLGLYSD